MSNLKTYAVWEPAIEGSDKSSKIDAETHGQAAFLAAATRQIGHRGATLVAYDGKEARAVTLEPRTWYAVVGVSEPISEAPMGDEAA